MASKRNNGHYLQTLLLVVIYMFQVDCQSCANLPSNWIGLWRLTSTTAYLFQPNNNFVNLVDTSNNNAILKQYRCETFFRHQSGNPGYIVRYQPTIPSDKQCIQIQQDPAMTIMSFWDGPINPVTNPQAEANCVSATYNPPPNMLVKLNTAVVCNSLKALNGAYQVQYKQFSSDSDRCNGDANSLAEISGMNIVINSCFGGTVSGQAPLKGATLKCEGEATNGVSIGGKVTDPVIVLLSYSDVSGNKFYYCGRILSARLEVLISIDVTSRASGVINCYSTQSFTTATDPSDQTNKYIALQFTANDCTQGKCLNGATCTQELAAYLCTCAAGYTGENCETNIDECASSPCQNGGTCNDLVNGFQCLCGNTGELSGTLCEIRNPCFSTPCQNNGVCNKQDNTVYTCTCPTNYSGTNCETELFCVPDPCKNGGTCSEVNPGNGYTCNCPTGFSGTMCETKLYCVLENNCQNGAICVEGVSRADCNCPNGFTGANCETELFCITSNNCLNGATCAEGSAAATCICVPGTTGARCETQLYCQPTNPCQNGGVCSEGVGKATCKCQPAFTGDTCQTELKCVTSNPCLNGATCKEGMPNPTCVCASGFIGQKCESTLFCEPNLCRNGATCEEAPRRCVCGPGWSGSLCDLKLACQPVNPCQSGGTCNENNGVSTCVCALGYTGATCETPISQCDSSPCKNGGVCTGDVNSFTCQCPQQWKIPTCEQPNNECTARPCQNGGVCDTNTKKCSCPVGFTGELCESTCTPSTCTTTTMTTTAQPTTATSAATTVTSTPRPTPSTAPTSPGSTAPTTVAPVTPIASSKFDWIPVIATVSVFGGLILIGAFIWLLCCCARSGGSEKVQQYPHPGPIIAPGPFMAPAIMTAAPPPQPLFAQAPTIFTTAPSVVSPIIEEPGSIIDNRAMYYDERYDSGFNY